MSNISLNCYLLLELVLYKQGWEFTLLSWETWENHSWLLFCKEWQERYALWHKKGKNCQKLMKNTNFSRDSRFLQAIFSNHKRISRIVFLKSDKSDWLKLLFCKEGREQIAHGSSLKLVFLSERAKSQWAKKQIPNPVYKHDKIDCANKYTTYVALQTWKAINRLGYG